MGRYDGYIWVYSPKAQRIAEELKKEIDTKAALLIKALKKEHLKKSPKKLKYNHLSDIYGKWSQQRFYLCSKYICPKDYLSPWFENKFARLEYTGKGAYNKDKFQLFYLRHTGEWIKILEDKTLTECFKAIKTRPYFTP